MHGHSLCVTPCYVPDSYPRRILLLQPPLYDTRFPWSQWRQPVTLLQLATLFHQYQCDVRLIDALQPAERVKRQRIRILSRGDVSVNYWRLGISSAALATQLRALQKENWFPDEVYIEGFTTIWWEGVVEAITLLRQRFPQTKVILYGAYPALAPEHALHHSGADVLVTASIAGLAGLPLDIALSPSRPLFTYLSIGTVERPSSDVVEEFLLRVAPMNVKERIRQILFADHDVIRRFPEQFRAVLKTAIDRKLPVSFYALGNLSPSDFVDDPELASLLFRANFKQLVFADDRDQPLTQTARDTLLEQYRHAIAQCTAAGYRKQTDALVGSASIGRAGENIEDTTSFVTELAHVAGSLILIPYQPSPLECPTMPLELQNGKLFPFAEHNGVTYRVYQDMLGLAAILNAKYRAHTFDFMGESLISQLVRTSLTNRRWDPHHGSDTQCDRPVTIGWFNKEGKWVKS